ncbi:hypothetical protein KY327_02085 [Candidatus Woesearchaeota archaeon]|nr:hypothetical protein [Candidatus Woesearchaeota archaeon]
MVSLPEEQALINVLRPSTQALNIIVFSPSFMFAYYLRVEDEEKDYATLYTFLN